MSPGPVPGDDRLDTLPLEALECRERGHSWPRSHSKSLRMTPTKYRGGRVIEAERTMLCEGGCGRIRVETFIIAINGHVRRAGGLRYLQAPGTTYLLPKPEDGEPLPHLDREEVRYALLLRLYPDLKW